MEHNPQAWWELRTTIEEMRDGASENGKHDVVEVLDYLLRLMDALGKNVFIIWNE